MLSMLVEMVPSYFAGYYTGQYRQGKMSLGKIFWRMFFISMGSLLLFALFFDYRYALDHWLRLLLIWIGGSIGAASLMTAFLWFVGKKTTEKK